MFDFHFKYVDGSKYDVTNVDKVILQWSGEPKEFSGDAILTANIPLKTMILRSSDRNTTISGDNLVAVDIIKRTT